MIQSAVSLQAAQVSSIVSRTAITHATAFHLCCVRQYLWLSGGHCGEGEAGVLSFAEMTFAHVCTPIKYPLQVGKLRFRVAVDV